MSHNPSDPSRNLKPTLPPQNAYSASPAQMNMQSHEMPSAGMPGQYNAYNGYMPHHDPSAYGYQPTQYRPQPQLQTRVPQMQPQTHLAQSQLPSPTQQMRKRRASELGGEPMISAPSSSIGGYNPQSSMQSSLMGPPSNEPSEVSMMSNSSAPPVTSPVIKKGRTNTPWSPAEEHRLKLMRDQGSSWSEIAKSFPNRTEGSVKKHWYKDMHYADFGEDEVSGFPGTALLAAIKEYEGNKWKIIGQKVGKPAKACEAYAKEQGWKV